MSDREVQIWRRLVAATPGPWIVRGTDDLYAILSEDHGWVMDHGDAVQDLADARFIAASHEDVGYLLEEVKRLKRIIGESND